MGKDDDNDIGDVLAAILAHMQKIKKTGLIEEIIDDANASTEAARHEKKPAGIENLIGSGEKRPQTDAHSGDEGNSEK